MPPTITATYLGGLRSECVHVASKNRIITDAPLDNCGKGEAFSPTDLCSAALGTCAMTIMAIAAQKMGRDLTGTRMEITKHMAADPRRIAKVEIIFHIPGSFTFEERQTLEKAATTCPVCLSLGPETEQAMAFLTGSTSEVSKMKTVIATKDAPAALGPYSQAIKAGNTLYISGQLGLDPATGQFAAPDAAGQAKQSLANLCAILKAAGATPQQVVKTTVLLADMNDFAAVNEIYAQTFGSDAPARSCFAVKDLPKGGKVEIEAIAAL